MGRPRLSDEERERRRIAAYKIQNIKRGHIPGAVGQPPKNVDRSKDVIEGHVFVKESPKLVNMPYLPPNPTAQDLKDYILALTENAARLGSAPAMIAAANTLQKEIDRFERNNPPQVEPPKPRPRIPVEIEIETVQCPNCHKTFEI